MHENINNEVDGQQQKSTQEKNEEDIVEVKQQQQESKQEKNEKDFCKEVMYIVTGNKPVPVSLNKKEENEKDEKETKEIFIKDRSVNVDGNDRELFIDYMEEIIKQMGYKDIERQVFYKTFNSKAKGKKFTNQYCNLVVTIPATKKKGNEPQKLIIIGAHYDVQNSLSSCWRGNKKKFLVTQGADDNTSGVIGCLALLKRFASNKIESDKTIKVVFFDGEEPGDANGLTVGSDYFVQDLINNSGTQGDWACPRCTYINKSSTNSCEMCEASHMIDTGVHLAYIIDMIGGPPTDPSLGFVISISEQLDTSDVEKKFDQVSDGTIVTVAEVEDSLSVLMYSDSRPFALNYMPAALMSNVGGLDNLPSFYHTENDTVEIIDWDAFWNAVDVSEKFVKLYL